jgi:hypothetical protein
VFPFLALMTRDAKRKTIILQVVCVAVLIGHWLDFYLMITPGTLKGLGSFGLIELGTVLLYFSAFAFVVYAGLNGKRLIAKHHPMIHESINHHT